jgi:NADPH-dependent 2,4-dienoyl-CoA reductase/sulfur reductase-like enzyme
MAPRREPSPFATALAVGIAAAAATAAFLGVLMAIQPSDPFETPPATRERPNPSDVYDPVRAGEEPPRGFRQLLGRDQIAPVYDPIYVARDEVDWPADSLVLGVAGSKTAKAYPITHLNQREMVIDSLDGTPILASW